MSLLAQDLLELSRMPRGALVEHLLRELACNLIAPGVADVRGDADMARIAMGVLALLILWLVIEIARAVKRIGDDEHHMH